MENTVRSRYERAFAGLPTSQLALLRTVYKFRTMSESAGPLSRQVWTRPNDRRITPVGRVLRAYRLNETRSYSM